jgi:hypothetical protein
MANAPTKFCFESPIFKIYQLFVGLWKYSLDYNDAFVDFSFLNLILMAKLEKS